MILYFIKSVSCLAILVLFYKLFLQKEAMHHFNRYYLLLSIFISMLIPLLVIETEPAIRHLAPESLNNQWIDYPHLNVNKELPITTEQKIDWMQILGWMYILVSIIFGVRFLKNLTIIFNKVKQNARICYKGIDLILLNENTIPFTFLSYIFVSKSDFENGNFTNQHFRHELTHLKEKHSYDIIFIEVLLIFFWFNPALFFTKSYLKLTHEFIADQNVIRESQNIAQYQNLLLQSVSLKRTYDLVSHLNYSLTKKRMEMMKKQTPKKVQWFKGILLLPLFAALIYFFSEKVEAQQKESQTKTNNIDNKVFKEINVVINSNNDILIENNKVLNLLQLKNVLVERTKDMDVIQKETVLVNLNLEADTQMGFITDVKDAFYEVGIKKIVIKNSLSVQQKQEQTMSKDEYYKNVTFKLKQANGSYVIKKYHDLSPKEKSTLFEPLLPPGEEAPSAKQLNDWLDLNRYGIWIDGKKTDNKELTNYKNTDFSYYVSSKLAKNAMNYGNHYIQIDLYTKKGFEKAFGKESGFREPLEKGTNVILPNKKDISENTVLKKESASKNNYAFMVPEAPPKPNPDKISYVKDLAKRGALFYIGPHRYNIEEVIELIQKSTNEVTIDVSSYPEVRLGGC